MRLEREACRRVRFGDSAALYLLQACMLRSLGPAFSGVSCRRCVLAALGRAGRLCFAAAQLSSLRVYRKCRIRLVKVALCTVL